MKNEQIVAQLELTAKLLELHAENDFKVRAFQSAVFQLDKTTEELAQLSPEALAALPGVGKSMAAKIAEICQTGQLA
jgi:DNA polymerase (family 10)